MQVLVDTTVLLDVLGRREPHWILASRIWTLAETGRLLACVSAISYNNTYYIVRKWAGKREAEQAVRLFSKVFATVDLKHQILVQAMDAAFSDFEDAIQYFSAIHIGADVIITHNPDDFPRTGSLVVMSPEEWLATLPDA